MLYTIIKSELQYEAYCDKLHELVENPATRDGDEAELLTFLIEKWDHENRSYTNSNPVEIIKFLMKDHRLNASDLGKILNLSKGTISKMLHYNKGLSKQTIRTLSEYFNLSQEIFNKPYPLVNKTNPKLNNSDFKNKKVKGTQMANHV
ncbi:MAG: helix-turn-helix domain-containing protein [Saprospiraceae bacterium]|nr:helix-turn-helix domain-containing protein [Saprospiraceae bacterium]